MPIQRMTVTKAAGAAGGGALAAALVILIHYLFDVPEEVGIAIVTVLTVGLPTLATYLAPRNQFITPAAAPERLANKVLSGETPTTDPLPPGWVEPPPPRPSTSDTGVPRP